MHRRLRIPKELSRRPVTLADARRAGLDRWHLQSRRFRRIATGTYLAADVEATPLHVIQAASQRLPDGGVFSGLTAAWLHGLDVEPCDPIEITVAPPTSVRTRAGMTVRRRELDSGEITRARGFRVTSVARTLRDLCARLSLVEAVVMIDMALHARGITTADLTAYARDSEAQPGVRMLRQAIEYVEPASESPMETRLRMLIIQRGLPRPEVQVAVRDRLRRFLGRPDLFYRDQRLGLEYDGATHEGSLAEDNRRQNRLLDAGVRLLRFTAADIYNTPDLVVSLVQRALTA